MRKRIMLIFQSCSGPGGMEMSNHAVNLGSRPRLGLVVLSLIWVSGLLAVIQHPPNCVATEAPPVFKLKWGSFGSGAGQFNGIRALAIDSMGNVYVAEANNNRIQKFTSDGTFITQWSVNSPGDVAVDAHDIVYVAELGTQSILKFTTDGVFLSVFTAFNDARNVAIDKAGNVYVVNHFFGFVYKFRSDGTFIIYWSAAPFPLGITTDSNGNVYVSLDRGDGPIMKFTSDGALLAQFPIPAGYRLAIDAKDNLYATDLGRNHILKFNPSCYLLDIHELLRSNEGKDRIALGEEEAHGRQN